MIMKRFLIRRMPHIWRIIAFLYFLPKKISLHRTISKALSQIESTSKHIFYCGRPMHANLGDLAQYVCIKKWLSAHYPNYLIVELPSSFILSKLFTPIKKIKRLLTNDDFFVFQSGYTTTDLGGVEDKMHKRIIKNFKDKKIIFFPQTIFFKSKKRKASTSKIYSLARRMLFLARDEFSYEQAKEMFKNSNVQLFPDIVTTLIGNVSNGSRKIEKDVLFCLRNDSEKLYSDDDINVLINKCKSIGLNVERTDTTKNGAKEEIIRNPSEFINKEIGYYSQFRIVVTDRYHGTIFSMSANCFVIVVKSNDHKVIGGANWFKGVYDDYHLASSLDDCFEHIKKYILVKEEIKRKSFFLEKYYSDNLTAMIEDI